MTAPSPVRSTKLSMFGPGQYYGWGPRWNPVFLPVWSLLPSNRNFSGARKYVVHPLLCPTSPLGTSRRYKADRMYRAPRLQGEWYMDTVKGRCKSKDGKWIRANIRE
jgi:hypothetical protein